jgi:hypothetical protein
MDGAPAQVLNHAPAEAWGPPAQAWGPPPTAPRASLPWRLIGTIAAFVVLVALLATTAFVWRGANGKLATSQDNLAAMTADHEAAQETVAGLETDVAGLETDVTDLEGKLNGANISLTSAGTCISGLQDATNAVRGFFGSEDWFTFYDRLRDVRGVCRKVTNGTVF